MPRRALLLVLGAVAGACACEEPSRIDGLLEALSRNDRAGSAELARLGPSDAAEAIGPITAMLARDDRRFVQVNLIRVLRNIGHRDGLPALARALDHKDPIVQANAAAAHFSISRRRKPGLDALVAGILGPPHSRRAALAEFEGVARIPLDVVPQLAAGVARGVPEAARALIALGPAAETALPALSRAMANKENLALRAAAAHAFYRLGGDPARALAQLVGDLPNVPRLAREPYHRAIVDLARGRPDAVAAEVERTLLAAERPEKTRLLGIAVLRECRIGTPILKRVAKEDPMPAVREAAKRAVDRGTDGDASGGARD